MPGPTFRHMLVLAVRLVDTSSGAGITSSGARFRQDGRNVFPMVKEQGNYVFLGEKREDFVLTVSIPDFEEAEIPVSYSELDAGLPSLEVQLIPRETRSPARKLLSLEGVLPGIASIDAVKLGDNHLMIKDHDPRKRTVTIFNPHRLGLDNRYYAVVNPDEETYEVFDVKTRKDDDSLIIEKPLERGFENHFPVCRVVFGAVYPDGRYCLRVRDDSASTRWIVRYKYDGTERFRTVDFSNPEPLSPDG